MLAKLVRRLTYANVASTLALFIALGGVSYAAATLPRNSVGPKQIKKNAVSSPKVKDRSLFARDFAPGQLPAGKRGPTGAAGLPGHAGATGARGPSDAYYAWQASTKAGSSSKVLALPAGSYVVTAKATVLCNEVWQCPTNAFGICTLDRGAGSVAGQETDTSYAWLPADTTTAIGTAATLASEIAVDLPSGGTITYACNAITTTGTPTATGGIYQEKLAAVRVESLH
jgi:hypothetical protein